MTLNPLWPPRVNINTFAKHVSLSSSKMLREEGER
jgi:hypothetical protein